MKMESSLCGRSTNNTLAQSSNRDLEESIKSSKSMKMGLKLKSLLSVAICLFLTLSINAQESSFSITSPDEIAGEYEAAFTDGWGGDVENLDGDATFANDGTEPVTDACEDAVMGVSGLISFIDRGACEFGQKALNAENAGAIAVVVCNNDLDNPDDVIPMGGGNDGALVTIPVLMISYNSCQTIRQFAEVGLVSARLSDGSDDGEGEGGDGEEGEDEDCSAGNFTDCGTVVGTSSLNFSLDECLALTDGSNADFSEFTATSTSENCASLSAGNEGTLYTNNPIHSCTPGQSGNAMCVAGQESCEFAPNSENAVFIDVVVDPEDSAASLSGLSFFEQAPTTYNWHQGQSQIGPNNWPTLYAVRVIKDGEMIFGQFDIPTNPTWTEASFSFEGNDFAVTETTTFTIELTAYCAIGNGVQYSIWDLDEIEINATCTNFVTGGTVTTDHGDEIQVCAGDGNPDVVNAEVCGNEGDFGVWVVTDADANIIALPPSGSVDFDGAGSGLCLLWWISSDEELNLEIGMNVSDVEGCIALSNPITVDRIGVKKSGITLEDGSTELTICTSGSGNGEAVTVISQADGSSTCQLVVTDTNDIIIDVPSGDPILGGAEGTCLIYEICSAGDLDLTVGGALTGSGSNAESCFAVSNSITVTKTIVVAATLTTAAGTTSEAVCVGDGMDDVIQFVQSGGTGASGAFVVTDADGNILAINDTGSVDFERAGPGVCFVWYLTYNGEISGAVEGGNAADLGGCFELSNPVQVTRYESTPTGTIVFSDGSFSQEICSGDGVSDPLTVITATGSGAPCQLVVTDAEGNILALPESTTIDFEPAGPGICNIYNVCTSGMGVQPTVGGNISDVTGSGCNTASNALTVIRNFTSTPAITTNTGATAISICAGDGSSDAFDVLLSNGSADGIWVITDENGIVLALPSAPPFDLEGEGVGTCLIWFLNDGNSGIGIGSDATTLGSCAGLSNPITVVRYQGFSPTNISFSDGTSQAEVCVGDGVSDFLTVVSNSGSGSGISTCSLIVTDANGTVLAFPSSNNIDFEDAGQGTCLVYELCHSGELQGNVGEDLSMVRQYNICSGLSNPLTVFRNGGSAPTLTTSTGASSISICAGDNSTDAFDVILSNATSGTYAVTDTNGTIISLPGGPPFDFDTFPVGTTCVLYYINGVDPSTVTVGSNVNSFGSACTSLSNPLTVTKLGGVDGTGGSIVLTTGLVKDFFCVTDGVPDLATVVSTSTGSGCLLVVTDFDGNIVEIPSTNTIDFEGATGGVCYIYDICVAKPEDVAIGQHISSFIGGCNFVSNRITISRIIDCDDMPGGGEGECTAVGGSIAISPSGATSTSICAGDGVSDAFDVSLTGNAGENSAWVITDADANILDLPAGPPFDLDGAGPGTCLVWHLSFDGTISGATVGSNAGNLSGCFDLSNPITVIRETVTATTIAFTDGSLDATVCIDDDQPDLLDVNSGSGTGCQTIITDAQGNILEISSDGMGLDFTNAPVGICLVYEACGTGEFTGAAGQNVNSTPLYTGCSVLSNSLTVTRSNCGDGGGMGDDCVCNQGGTFNATVTLTNQNGGETWDECEGLTWMGTIEWREQEDGTFQAYSLGPDGETFFNDMSMGAYYTCYDNPGDQDALPNGTLAIEWDCNTFEITGASQWDEVYDVTNIEIEGNTMTFNWTNDYGEGAQVVLVRKDGNDFIDESCNGTGPGTDCEAEGGTLTLADGGSTSITICASDGQPENIGVNLEGASGSSSAYVVTDDQGNILEINSGPPFNFEGVPPGVCLIWHLSHEDDLMGAEVGANAADLSGCFDLSNSITVVRTVVNGTEISFADGSSTTTVCTEDSNPDVVSITSDTGSGSSDCFLVLVDDMNKLILDTSPSSSIAITGSGSGECTVYEVCGNGTFIARPGTSFFTGGALFSGCYAVSNALTVVKDCGEAVLCESNGGEIFTIDGSDEHRMCAANGISSMVNVSMIDNQGDNSSWLITNAEGDILHANIHPPFSFDGMNSGVYLIWHLSYNDDMAGLQVGMNAADLTGCHHLSNPITVFRSDVVGGQIALIDGQTTKEICLSDDISDVIQLSTNGTLGFEYTYVVADQSGFVIDILEDSEIDMAIYGKGSFFIYGVSYSGDMILEIGDNIIDSAVSTECYDVSANFVAIDGDDSGLVCGNIEEPSAEVDFLIYPNPATDFITVEVLSVPDLDNTRIEMYDAAGQLITSKTLNVKASNIEEISLQDYANGYYFVKMVSKDEVKTKSFVITK